MKRVFIDMDNVLVDFQSGLDLQSDDIKRQYDGCLDEIPGLFARMKPMPGAIDAVHRLQKHYDLFILSTAPWKNPTAWLDKVKWVTEYLDDVFHKRMVITHRKDLCKGDYLIDDRGKNGTSEFSGEWMLVTAGDESSCNTMTASWGHLGCLWGHNDPTAVIYLRPSRYTKEFVDEEGWFSLCVMDKSFKKQMAYLGSVSGRDEDKIAKTGLTPVFAEKTVYFQEAKLVLVCKKMYASELQESGFLYQETIDESYPLRDFHTMYVGKIEKVLVRDDEYLK